MRIMYVEDNMVNLSLVRRIAQMGAHEVISYSNGIDALEALQTDAADLILMDIELEGELDGVEVVKRLRARGDKRPIVALTAYAMVGDKERILDAGCDDYLPKPLPISKFLEILARYDPKNLQPDEPQPEEAKFLGGGNTAQPETVETKTSTEEPDHSDTQSTEKSTEKAASVVQTEVADSRPAGTVEAAEVQKAEVKKEKTTSEASQQSENPTQLSPPETAVNASSSPSNSDEIKSEPETSEASTQQSDEQKPRVTSVSTTSKENQEKDD